ncbi:hypothetical protein [Hymenobacter volaticus]|uniref:Bulb-type lectin domain-containing protein n=1 Tax=Hymenobacter volaticus TaxID=2932254 RepID=A0ABY4GE74_9BACT|nr:hypothetical protein [Hymenobacter volaticus]UOQ69095.1 hypothetical protein MUN86_26725 [Hymenobacter volaticus]
MGEPLQRGGNGYDEATALTTDAAGNVLVTGYADTGNQNWDYLTLKYATASGAPQWQARYNGPDGGYDEAREVAVDGQGNVTVTGRSFNAQGQSEYATVRYAGASGQALWQVRALGPNGESQAPTGLAVDAAGNVAVTGSVVLSSSDTDYATLRYSATGQLTWRARYASPFAQSAEAPTDLAVDAAGNVYVTGTAPDLVDGRSNDYLTLKYAPSGQQLWEARYSGPSPGYEMPLAVAVDAAGNVYVTGTSAGIGGDTSPNRDVATIKYSPTGQQLWVARYDGPDPVGSGDFGSDLALDAAGNVLVTGFSTGLGTNYDYLTLKYSPSGQPLWQARYNGPANGSDVAQSVAVDAAGYVVVTGSSEG